MQRLSAFTNVIPVIAKSETLSAQELISLKASILARLQATSIKPFLFGKPLDDELLAVQGLDIVYPLASPTTAIHTGEPKEPNQFPFPTPTHPYAISSIHGSDNDTMDASLLMSPDYVQPLVLSELSNLIEQVFDPESIAWLRHAAAKKFLAWRRRTKFPGDSFIMHGLQQPRSPTTASVGLAGTMMNRRPLCYLSPDRSYANTTQHPQLPPSSPPPPLPASSSPAPPRPFTQTFNLPSSPPSRARPLTPPLSPSHPTSTTTRKRAISASQNGLQTCTRVSETRETDSKTSSATSAPSGSSNASARKSKPARLLLATVRQGPSGRLSDV